jgi:hypothetical protein
MIHRVEPIDRPRRHGTTEVPLSTRTPGASRRVDYRVITTPRHPATPPPRANGRRATHPSFRLHESPTRAKTVHRQAG